MSRVAAEDTEVVAGFLSRNKLTGVALTMLLEAIALGVLGSWWVRGETAELHTTDLVLQKDVSALQNRVTTAEANSERIEDKVLREIKEMRAEVNQRIERIDDKLDRRRQ